MSTAAVVPSWMTAVNAAPGSSHPANAGTIRRWPVLEIGRNSVSPCTIPRMIASKADMEAARLPAVLRPLLRVGLLLLALLAPALARLLDLLDGLLAAVPAVHLHLLLLEVLVDREEVRDLLLELLGQVVELLEG